jgi:hypothetical protein
MNLVKAQELAKDLSIQDLQRYANGAAPEMIPPWMATGELQAKMARQQKMQAMQGAAQGQQPSVKEQVEQKAGLMALQAQQQQQAQQQMMQQTQSQPMPVPAGAPQPAAQPQEQPTMMARGGLASAPVSFNFQRGGIVAFDEGGSAEDPRRARRSGESFADFRKRMFELDLQLQREKNAAEQSGREAERQRRLAERGGPEGVIPPSPFMDRAALPIGAPTGSPTDEAPAETARLRRQNAAAPAPVTGQAPAGLPGAAQLGTGAQAPAARPAGLPGALPQAQQAPQSEVSQLALDALRNPAKSMTPEQAMAKEGAMAAGYGMDKPFGGEERGLMELMKKRQSQYSEGRPMAELAATLRGFGQGYGGASAAGERAGKETFDADMAHQREMLNAVNALNKTNLDTNKERYKTSGALFGKDQESTAAANRERMQTLGQMRNQDVQAGASKYAADMQFASAKLAAAAREQGMGSKEIQAAEAAFARDPEASAIKKQLENPILANNPKKYSEALGRLRAIQASKYAQFGIKLEEAPGAASPGGTSTSGWGKAQVVKQ